MADSIFSNIIYLIPLAIIIGRIVMQFRSKKGSAQRSKAEEVQKPPPRKTPPISVHFEDDDVYLPPKEKQKPVLPKAIAMPKGMAIADEKQTGSVPELKAGVINAPVKPIRQPAEKLPLYNLSPLKQAVVMAEILGRPKALKHPMEEQ